MLERYFCLKMMLASKMYWPIYPSHKNEGFDEFWEGWVPFLLDIQAESGMVSRYATGPHELFNLDEGAQLQLLGI